MASKLIIAFSRRIWFRAAGAAALAAVVSTLGTATADNLNITYSTVSANAYGTSDINSCGIIRDNLTTYGGYQYAAFYDSNGNIVLGRRTSGATQWNLITTNYQISSSLLSDDHNVIAIGIDSNGYLHMSWGMHNQNLNYVISKSSVTGKDWSGSSLAFTTLGAPVDPASGVDSNNNEVTYPEFYTTPSGDLLFSYRNGGTGGGSGNGNNYLDIYNPASRTWSQNFTINGESTSVNGYINRLAYSSTGKLMMSWTWRATPNWQTNSNIMFAQSTNNGSTWTTQSGVSEIAASGGITQSTAQIIETIPEGSSLINQSNMAVDRNSNPVIATWYAPGSLEGGSNNTRQYMLVYYNGANWQTSQITDRPAGEVYDSSGAYVRQLARPIVLVDREDRVLVIMRYNNDINSDGSPNADAALPGRAAAGGGIVVAYSQLTSKNGISSLGAWNYLTLYTANLGQWEPTYDAALWQSSNILDLFVQPVGLGGETSSTAQVLQWNEAAYFASVPGVPPALLLACGLIGISLLARKFPATRET